MHIGPINTGSNTGIEPNIEEISMVDYEVKYSASDPAAKLKYKQQPEAMLFKPARKSSDNFAILKHNKEVREEALSMLSEG